MTGVFHAGLKVEASKALLNACFQARSPMTVYSHKYLFFIMDKAHLAWKHNLSHLSTRALWERSMLMVAMTATPVTTKPQDLFIMGQLLGIESFFDYEEFMTLNHEVSHVTHHDNQALREEGEEGSLLCGVLIELHNPDTSKLEFKKVMLDWMAKMRECFAVYVICRMIDSLNCKGNKIFGMQPYIEHILRLNIYDWEMNALRDFVKDIVKDNPISAVDTRKHFYIEFRRSMLHPCLNPKSDEFWKKPKSLDAWKNSPERTIKLDVLAQLVTYHLKQDGSKPLTMEDDRKMLTLNNDYAEDAEKYPECDCIVVYAAFLSLNQAILDIFNLYNIKTVELNGSMSLKHHQEALSAFRTSTNTSGPRVLILSNVGVVRLNLACANVMVILDTMWSALDDEQLKGQMHTAFMDCHQEIKNLFPGEQDDDINDILSLGNGTVSTQDAQPNVRKSTQGKAKSAPMVVNKDDVDMDFDPDDLIAAEPPKGQNKCGSKKAILKSPQAGEKQHLVTTSSTNPNPMSLTGPTQTK
ncbi:hypothetical protein J3R83DRAFT_11786 [Lanmaoa asiatica]|nr:hypothetical protein J3R83DRAFT_11786 [Lanmaoa asiatica]